MDTERLTDELLESMPEGWGGVTLEMWPGIRAAQRLHPENRVTAELTLYAALTGRRADELRALPVAGLLRLRERAAFADTPPPQEPAGSFTHQGIRYAVPEDLGTVTVGQWADFDQILATRGADEGLPTLIAIFARPEGDTGPYDGRAALKRAEALRTLPVPAALGLAAFFLQTENALRTASRLYSVLTESLTPAAAR